MRQVNVLIDDFTKRNEMVNIMEKMEVHAILGQGNSAIDASSLMGVMTIAPSGPIALSINESNEVADRVIEKIRKFIVP